MIKAGAATAAARKTFSANRQKHGFFGAVGAIGRKSTSTPTTAQLARSGKMRAGMVVGGAAGMSGLSKRRGSGTGRRTPGRPTGMYGH